ncbi:hypothetical protein TRVL_10222 [Trypanosoma vivax]|nr:hypothetical protein TRVL_10222 [Trypanosoma vivax]
MSTVVLPVAVFVLSTPLFPLPRVPSSGHQLLCLSPETVCLFSSLLVPFPSRSTAPHLHPFALGFLSSVLCVFRALSQHGAVLPTQCASPVPRCKNALQFTALSPACCGVPLYVQVCSLCDVAGAPFLLFLLTSRLRFVFFVWFSGRLSAPMFCGCASSASTVRLPFLPPSASNGPTLRDRGHLECLLSIASRLLTNDNSALFASCAQSALFRSPFPSRSMASSLSPFMLACTCAKTALPC